MSEEEAAPALRSDRLLLRRMTAADAPAFSRYRSDPAVARYQSWDAPYSLGRAERFIAGMQGVAAGAPGEWLQLAITLREGGDMIGDVAFSVLGEDPRQAEIGFTLAAAYQGLGYGGEAVRRLLDYLFDDPGSGLGHGHGHGLGLHRVRANCDPRNTRSARLMERVGMRHEGRWVDSLWFKGGWVSEDWYAILRCEWAAGSQ